MALCTYDEVRDLTNISSSDISDADVTKIIAKATVELNRKINTSINRELIQFIDNTRQNKIDGSNTTYYIQKWKGNYLADKNNDGTVGVDDVLVYQVDSAGTETSLTVSSITHDEGKFVLSSAPASGVTLYVTYEYSPRDVSTPDPIIKLACIYLTASYCYGKLNIGRAPKLKVGNKSIERDMKSPEYYRSMAYNLINDINTGVYLSADSTETF